MTCGTLHCTGAAVIDGQLTLEDALLVNGLAVLAGGLQLNGTLSGSYIQTARRKKQGAGRDLERVTVMPSDANQTISFSTTDYYFVPSTLLTTGRTLTLDDVGAEGGAKITILTEDTTRVVTVQGTGALFPLSLRLASTEVNRVTLVYVSGHGWKLFSYTKN